MANYQEAANQLFEAMDLITSKRVSALEFDKTLVCTIEEANSGVYKVTDGSSHFQAYPEDTSTVYTVGTKVYVKVPNGNMDNQKIITGKYITAETEYITYISPLNSFIDVSGNIVEAAESRYALKANTDDKIIIIWEYESGRDYSEEKRQEVRLEIDSDTSNYQGKRLANYNSYKSYSQLYNEIMEESDDNLREILLKDLNGMTIPSGYKGYERLGLSGEFKTLVDNRTVSGSYGLRLDVYGMNSLGIYEFKRYYLDANEMYGDPYKYSTYYKQEYLYDISDLKEIVNMRLIFYQSGDFLLEDGTVLIPDGRDDIFLQDPYVSLGFDVNNFNEDKILLGTNDSLMYSSDITPKERNVYMRWVHKNDDEVYAIDELKEKPEDAVIHWYRYKLENDRFDELAGTFWKEFRAGEDEFNYIFEPDTTVDTDALKVIIEIPSRDAITANLASNQSLAYAKQQLQLQYDAIPSGLINGISEMETSTNSQTIEETYGLIKVQYIKTDKQTELFNEIYTIITEERAKTQYYSSDTLTFTNAIPQNLEAIDLIRGLSIEVDEEGYQGVYRLYDESCHILNSTESSRLRTLKATYSSVITGIKGLDSAEEIVWYIPISNTMIHEPVLGKEYTEEDEYITDCGREGYVAIKRYGTEVSEQLEAGLSLIETEQSFRIKDHYTQTATNNIIYCDVKKRGKTYEAYATLLFGPVGSNGTEATFLLKMYNSSGADEVSALTIGDSVLIVPELYDYNNKPMSISNVKYSWEQKNDSGAITGVQINNNYQLTAANMNIDNFHHYILKGSIKYTIVMEIDDEGKEITRDVNLSTYLPIPVRTDKKYVEIEGASQIVYDVNGVNPRYYKNPYKLYGNGLQAFNATWYIYSEDFSDASAIKYYPTLSSDGVLAPTKMYYTGLEPVYIYAAVDGATVWTQPLIIIQNKYSSALLNDWDGDLTIDEKNGTILSAMIGAGTKNSDNTFSGVLMGNIDKAFENNGIGLYGFDKGEQSYGFKADGTAFIGKSGKGRIIFDGEKGTITSGNYQKNVSGMQIDLDDSFIKAYGDAGAIEIDAKATKNLFKITSSAGNPLINITGADGNYYIQSDNFTSDGVKSGMKININKGILETYGTDDDGNASGDVYLSANGNPYFRIRTVVNGDNQNILYFGKNNIYLQSANYSASGDEPKSGMKINITKGILEAIGVDDDSGIRIGDIRISASGNPYFRIRTVYNDDGILENKSLIYISKQELYLASADYRIRTNDKEGAGTKIDLGKGKITSYDFTINAYGKYLNTDGEEENGFIQIDSGQATHPFNVNDRFKIDWGGNVILNSLKAIGGTIGGWYIDEHGIYDYNPEKVSARTGMALLSSGDSSDSDLRIAVGSLEISKNIESDLNGDDEQENYTRFESDSTGFFVYKNGDMKCTGATIVSSTIESADINDATISRGTITSATIKKAKISSGTINSATITGNCKVNGTLTGGTITGSTITAEGLISCGGLNINGTSYEPRQIKTSFCYGLGEGATHTVLTSDSTISISAGDYSTVSATTGTKAATTAYGTLQSDGSTVKVTIPAHTHTYSHRIYEYSGSINAKTYDFFTGRILNGVYFLASANVN